MLKITVPAMECFDESNNVFVYLKEQTLQLEHSLVSVSKWESKWHKSFFTKEDKTYEETIDYIRCMTITQNADPSVYFRLTKENIDDVNAYIDNSMTATTFVEDSSASYNREIVTSEIIYYWMISFGIPQEYQKWHLNRLLTLIRVCNIKSHPPKKRSKKEIMSRNAALNASRRKRLNTKG